MNSTLDIRALFVAILVAASITVALMTANRGVDYKRRGWIVAALLILVLGSIGFIDLLRESPRETRAETVVFGAAFPVLSALGLIRATRRVSQWIRWTLVFVTALVALFAGLIFGASLFYRFLPG